MTGFMDYRPAGFIKGTATAAPNIYDADGNLILQLGYVAGVSSIKGQVATGTDVNFYPNSTDAYPYFRLHGAGEVQVVLPTTEEFQILDATTKILSIKKETGKTTITGKVATTEDLRLKANETDDYPYIQLNGTRSFLFSHPAGYGCQFYEETTQYLFIHQDTDAVIDSSETNQHLFLNPNGTGKVKFGTYVGGAATDSTGYIIIKDAGGADRKLMVQA